jgi:hypothetical protein
MSSKAENEYPFIPPDLLGDLSPYPDRRNRLSYDPDGSDSSRFFKTIKNKGSKTAKDITVYTASHQQTILRAGLAVTLLSAAILGGVEIYNRKKKSPK